MRLVIAALTICITLSVPTITYARPDINDIAIIGLPADGTSLVITGSGFGTQGPTLHIYDNFDDAAVVGNNIGLGATIGNWLGYNTNPPTYDDIGFSGDRSMRVFTGLNGDTDAQIIKANFAPTTELYLSYWLYLPVGSTFPGSQDPNFLPNTWYATNNLTNTNCSTWKIVWVFDGDNASNNNDITMPTYVCGDLQLQGNNTRGFGDGPNIRIRLIAPSAEDHNIATNSTILFRYGEWIRMTFWLKANESDPLLPGNVRWTYEIPTSNIRQVREDNTRPLFCGPPDTCAGLGGPKPPYQWTHMNFTGYTGHGGDWSLTRPLIDEVYLATGAGAQARVEVCDTPQYTNCKKFGYITILDSNTDWSDTTISGTIHKGSLASNEIERAYAYVFDENGLVNADGYPLCPKCPLPPSKLQVE